MKALYLQGVCYSCSPHDTNHLSSICCHICQGSNVWMY